MGARIAKILLAVCCAATLLAADDPKEILRRALYVNAHNEEVALNYTYLLRQENRALDGDGKVKHVESSTWDITRVEGSAYRRLVQKNDKPLPPKEEQEQRVKLEKSIEQRRSETPEQRTERLAAAERRVKKREQELSEVPDAFDLRILTEEMVGGEPAWIIEGTPHPGYKPKSKTSTYFLKIKGRIWIAKRDYQPIKIEAESTDTISIGAFLVRLSKGVHLGVEFSWVNGEVWLPKRVSITGSARVLLVKGFHIDSEMAFSNYKKFVAESRVVPPAN